MSVARVKVGRGVNAVRRHGLVGKQSTLRRSRSRPWGLADFRCPSRRPAAGRSPQSCTISLASGGPGSSGADASRGCALNLTSRHKAARFAAPRAGHADALLGRLAGPRSGGDLNLFGRARDAAGCLRRKSRCHQALMGVRSRPRVISGVDPSRLLGVDPAARFRQRLKSSTQCHR